MESELNRRVTDVERTELDASFGLCPMYLAHTDFKTLHEDVRTLTTTVNEMNKTVLNMNEVVTAWNDTKSALKVIQGIGKILLWLAGVGSAIALIWYFLTGKGSK